MSGLRVLVIGAGVGGISIARGLLRDGHQVTVFEQSPDVKAAGGAVTIWSNGATVLAQLGVDMDDAGQSISAVRVVTSTGRSLAAIDVNSIVHRLGASVRMVPRRILLERLLDGFPQDRIRSDSRAVGVTNTPGGVRVQFDDGTSVEGDVLIGADGLHSVVRDVLGAQCAKPTGWCSWQGLVTIPDVADVGIADKTIAQIFIGERGTLGLWPAGGAELQWWFDLPWSSDFVRPARPIDVLRASFTGWCTSADRVLALLTDEDLARSPFPHFRHPVPRSTSAGPITLLGDAAHTMPPTLAQGTNQALLDTMVLREALSRLGEGADNGYTGRAALSSALRWYEKTRRRQVMAVSWLASVQVARRESVLRPAAMIPDRLMTWALVTFLRSTSHARMSTAVSHELKAASPRSFAAMHCGSRST